MSVGGGTGGTKGKVGTPACYWCPASATLDACPVLGAGRRGTGRVQRSRVPAQQVISASVRWRLELLSVE